MGISHQPVCSNNDIDNNNKSLFPAQSCGAARMNFKEVIPSSRSIVWGSCSWFRLGSSAACADGSSRELGTGCKTCPGCAWHPEGIRAQAFSRPACVSVTTAVSPCPFTKGDSEDTGPNLAAQAAPGHHCTTRSLGLCLQGGLQSHVIKGHCCVSSAC